MRAFVRSLLLLVFVSTAGCAPLVDLTKGLQVEITNTGWFDLGIVNGQNKLVPTVTFTVKNISDQKLVALQVQALFRRVGETEEWGSGFMTAVGSQGLPPGETTKPITMRSERGYTGSDQSRQEMLQNSHFVDGTVELQAKYASSQWARLGTYPIKRQVITK